MLFKKYILILGVLHLINPFSISSKEQKTPYIFYDSLEDQLNENSKLVLTALLVIAQSKTKWASIANEQLLDLSRYSNKQIELMYKTFLSFGLLKMSIPSNNLEGLKRFCFFKFNLNELKQKGVHCKMTLLTYKKK